MMSDMTSEERWERVCQLAYKGVVLLNQNDKDLKKVKKSSSKRNKKAIRPDGRKARKLLTLAETAKRLGVSERTILRWKAQGKIKTIKLLRKKQLFLTEEELTRLKTRR